MFNFRRPRHARSRPSVRPWLAHLLLAVLAAADLVLPVSGGMAPGPQIVIAAILIGLIFRHRRPWRGFFILLSAGSAVLAVGSWNSAWEHYLATGLPAWDNTAAGWILAAALSGFVAAVLREQDRAIETARIARELALLRRALVGHAEDRNVVGGPLYGPQMTSRPSPWPPQPHRSAAQPIGDTMNDTTTIKCKACDAPIKLTADDVLNLRTKTCPNGHRTQLQDANGAIGRVQKAKADLERQLRNFGKNR